MLFSAIATNVPTLLLDVESSAAVSIEPNAKVFQLASVAIVTSFQFTALLDFTAYTVGPVVGSFPTTAPPVLHKATNNPFP